MTNTNLVFTDKNISSIAGRGKSNSPERLQQIREALASHAEGLNKLAAETGLTATNISSILSRSYSHAVEAIEVLSSDDTIASLKILIKKAENPAGIFTAENLSSMLNGSGARLAEGVKALVENKDKLKEFIKSADNPDGIFTATNLSSMLDGSGARLAEGVAALVKNKDKLKEIIDEGIFTAENLSSMLNGSGARLAEGVKALVENKDKLKEFIKSADNPDGIFTATNLSSMLAVSGARLAEVIEAIHSRKEKLLALGKKYDPSSVSQKLNKTAPGERGAKIDAMYKTLESEIGGTQIPADSDAEIAAANQVPNKVVGL